MSRGPGPWDRAGGEIGAERFGEASDWFARMRAPDAETSREAFELWRSDIRNARAYAEIEAIWEATAHARIAPVRRVRLRPGLIAAGIAGALTLGLLAQGVLRPGGLAGADDRRSFSASAGADQAIELADGSRIALASGGRLRSEFVPAERRVALLAGTARFTVAHDAGRPFVVVAGADAVVARGTVFDVALGEAGTRVTLIEGAVDLERRGPSGVIKLLGRLGPGDTALFGAAEVQIGRIEARGDRSNFVAADGMRLTDLLNVVNRRGAGPRLVAAPAVGDLRVSGGFPADDPAQVAEGLAAALDLSVSAGGGDTIVLTRRAPATLTVPVQAAVAR